MSFLYSVVFMCNITQLKYDKGLSNLASQKFNPKN